ncbi:CapA family protein [Kitasatospora sp. NPDC101801]|uniref:CapA family protein n=1 Tax=Kitasatospora sp. NPDC101801 TaxID=3364103 RepID=UPI00380C6292
MHPPRRAVLLPIAALLVAGAGCSAPAPQQSAAPEPLPSPSSTPSSAPSPGPTAPPVRPFTLVASGDVLPHSSIIRQAQADAGGTGYDFGKMLAGIKPVVASADLAICHMETVYGADGGPYTGYPTFKSPPQVAQALRDTGYDSCSTASNHTLDAGAEGITRTLGAMDAVGLEHVGSARNAAESARPALLTAGGAAIAQLAYSYDTNGIALPEGQPWAVNLIDRDRILADARAARKAGADIVLVSMHWGTEWQDEPNEQQLTLAQELTAAQTDGRRDVDLVLGTHAHIPQAYELVNGTWVVYGMGDQIAGDMYNYSGDLDPRGNQSTIARFTFTPPTGPKQPWTVSKAEFIPQVIDLGTPNRVLNLNEALKQNPGNADWTKALEHIRTTVLSRGGAAAGLTMTS